MDIIRRWILKFLFSSSVSFVGYPGSKRPTRAHSGDVGYDLYVSSEISIPPNSFVDVPTGIYFQMDTPLWCRITGRSSTIRKWNLLVQEGIIDTGYVGELFIGVWNLNGHEVILQKGTRIAQVIFFYAITPNLQRILFIKSKDGRGSDGFGSTGV